MPDNPKPLRKFAWMPVVGRKVLFARSQREKEIFYCVGGKIEPGETPERALAREVREETTVLLKGDTIKHFKTFTGPSHTGGEMEMIIFEAQMLPGQMLVPANEVAELAWFTSADKYRTTAMGVILLDWYKEQNLID